jgi:hypothetical protein
MAAGQAGASKGLFERGIETAAAGLIIWQTQFLLLVLLFSVAALILVRGWVAMTIGGWLAPRTRSIAVAGLRSRGTRLGPIAQRAGIRFLSAPPSCSS